MTARFEFTPFDHVGVGRLANKHWTLCLGAGINGPSMPNWEQLVHNLTNTVCGHNLTKDRFHKIWFDSGWSLEAWIQQALNWHIAQGRPLEDFTSVLREGLYKGIDDLQKKDGLATIVTDALGSATSLSKEEWLRISDFFDHHFSNTTVYRLAKLFVDEPKIQLPESIFSFNADTLFETIYGVSRKIKHNEGKSEWFDPPQTFSRVVRSSQDIWGHIPIYHLHGCLPPKSSRRKKIKENSEGMIFPENSYTGLAGRVFTWAQNTFLHKAQTNALCFVGMSMTDANIRRWLSWAFETYIEELRIAHAVKIEDIGGRHVWLQTKSQLSAEAIQMYPYALRHLGVQVCWLDNWDQIQSALKSLIGFR